MTPRDLKAARAGQALKELDAAMKDYSGEVQDVPGWDGIMRAKRAFHEKARRWAEQNEPEITPMFGDT